MALYKHIRNQWNNSREENDKMWRQRLIQWRAEPVTVRVERPTRLDRARSLGYKAKPGIVVVRQQVTRGGHKHEQIRAGRRSKRYHLYFTLRKSYKVIAEERAQRKFINMVVLNSYYLAQDGMHYWYEVILVDPEHPQIKADRRLNWICAEKNRARVFHGKTSAGKKMRGLRIKGKGAEKARPSRRANDRHQ